MTIHIAMLIVSVLLGLQIGAAISYFWPILWQIIYGRMKPWQKYDPEGFRRVVKHFALLHDQVVVVPNGDKIVEFNTDDDKTFQAAGLFIPYGKNLYLDTKLLRCHESVVRTLLHEICHWNQYVQGRLMGPVEMGIFGKDPIEKEAEAFSKAWIKTGMKVYKGEYGTGTGKE